MVEARSLCKVRLWGTDAHQQAPGNIAAWLVICVVWTLPGLGAMPCCQCACAGCAGGLFASSVLHEEVDSAEDQPACACGVPPRSVCTSRPVAVRSGRRVVVLLLLMLAGVLCHAMPQLL